MAYSVRAAAGFAPTAPQPQIFDRSFSISNFDRYDFLAKGCLRWLLTAARSQ